MTPSPNTLPMGQHQNGQTPKREMPIRAKRPKQSVAGWSSPVARQAHNLKVVGSNPTPATKLLNNIKCLKPDLISRAFACAILVNALSTFDESPLKNGAFCVWARSAAASRFGVLFRVKLCLLNILRKVQVCRLGPTWGALPVCRRCPQDCVALARTLGRSVGAVAIREGPFGSAFVLSILVE